MDRGRNRVPCLGIGDRPVRVCDLDIDVSCSPTVILPHYRDVSIFVCGYLRSELMPRRSAHRDAVRSPGSFAHRADPLHINIGGVRPVIIPYDDCPTVAIAHNLRGELVFAGGANTYTIAIPHQGRI